MFLSKPLATKLAEIAKVVGSPLQQSYRNTIYCNVALSQDAGKVKGTYCGNRWCMTCTRIRAALSIERYKPALDGWSDKHFVTLTLKNVPAAELATTLVEMLAGFTAAKRAIKRTDKCPFKALRKLECTYNVATDEYHPHFHVLVEGRRAAKLLVARWIEHFDDGGQNAGRVDAAGQDIRPVRAKKGDGDEAVELLEVFKYFTKLVSKSKLIPPKALDVIFRSMRGRRVYQPVGFVAPRNVADDEGELPLDQGTDAPTRAGECVTWVWQQGAADWVDRDTGDCLSGYEPAEKFRSFVERIERPESDQAEMWERIRGLPPEISAKQIEGYRDDLRRRVYDLDRSRFAIDESKVISKHLRRIYDLSAERTARLDALAALVALPPEQCSFLPPSSP